MSARWLALFLIASGCRTAASWTQSQLYFGTACGAGCTPVSDADWERFVAEQITPRFPAGFTVIPARGRWQGDAGAQDEQTYLLMVVYPASDPSAPAKLQELRKLYRDAFRQEAVLEVDLPAAASF